MAQLGERAGGPPGGGGAATGEWECMECGYEEEGVQARRPKACPECGAPSEAFEFFSAEEDEWDEDTGLDDEDLDETDELDEDSDEDDI